MIDDRPDDVPSTWSTVVAFIIGALRAVVWVWW